MRLARAGASACVAVIAGVVALGAAGVRPARPAPFWPGHATYQDALGSVVHQLTVATAPDGQNVTPYYHQNVALDGDRIVIVNITGAGAEYSTLDVRTGERRIVAPRGAANGEFVRDGFLYGFHYGAAGQAWVGRLDVETSAWEHYAPRSPGYQFAAGVGVNAHATRVVWEERATAGPFRVRVRTFDAAQGAVTLYEGPDAIEHMVFSPTDPDLFFFVNQSAGASVRRLGLGNAATHGMRAIAPEGDYWTRSFMLADPFWRQDGRLASDVLWHADDPPGTYSLASFDVADSGADGATIPPARQLRRTLPTVWRNQHVNPTSFPDWFVGDGDPQGFFSGYQYVSLFHIPLDGPVRVYPLASHRGPLPHAEAVPNSHALPGGDAVVTTWRYDAASGRDSAANVYLIEVPRHLRRAMAAGWARRRAPGIELPAVAPRPRE